MKGSDRKLESITRKMWQNEVKYITRKGKGLVHGSYVEKPSKEIKKKKRSSKKRC